MENETTRMTLRLPNEIKAQLEQEAKADNRSLHNLIITILQNHTEHPTLRTSMGMINNKEVKM